MLRIYFLMVFLMFFMLLLVLVVVELLLGDVIFVGISLGTFEKVWAHFESEVIINKIVGGMYMVVYVGKVVYFMSFGVVDIEE